MATIPAPVINTGLDLTKMGIVIAKMASTLVRKYFKNTDATKQIPIDYDVTKSKRYGKVLVKGRFRKYDGAIKTTDGQVILSDRELNVGVGQKELPLEPEQFRNTWANEMADISAGKVPLEIYILDDYTKNSMQDLDELFYKGDTASTDSLLKICDGLEKIMLAETTGATPAIVPVSVPAFDAGSGSGLNAVAGNYNAVCKTVWRAQQQALKENETDMYLSIDNYAYFGESYRREHSHEATYNKDVLDQEFVYLDGTQKKCKIRSASWLGASNRVWVFPKGAIRIGTDIKQMVGSIKFKDEGYYYLYLCKMVFGVQIIDLEAVTVSSRA